MGDVGLKQNGKNTATHPHIIVSPFHDFLKFMFVFIYIYLSVMNNISIINAGRKLKSLLSISEYELIITTTQPTYSGGLSGNLRLAVYGL